MLPLAPAAIRKILLIGAHADDIEIGLGATLLTWQARYPQAEIRWIVFSGEAQRRAEAQSSAEAFLEGFGGNHRIQFESFRDSYFPAEFPGLKERMQAIAAEFSPDLIFTHYTADGHQDHRALSDLTHNAFRNHWILEYEIPKYDSDLGNPSVFVPISKATAQRKIDLLMQAFPSQVGKPWFREETFWATLTIRGMQCKAESGLAEGFYCRKMCL